MFEKIVLRSSESGSALTIGEFAEALLFYQNVHLILDHSTLINFIKHISIEHFLDLLSRPNISAVYCEEVLGTQTIKMGVTEAHKFVAITITGDKDVGHLGSHKKRMAYILQKYSQKKTATSKQIDKFLERVPVRKLTGNDFLPGGIGKAAIDDLHDPAFVHEAIRLAILNTVGAPSVLVDFKFDILHSGDNFFVFTDINLDEMNSIRRRVTPPLGDISNAFFINKIQIARADLAFAAHYGGDFSTSEITSQIIRLRYRELLHRTGVSTEELRQLREIVLSGSPAIREVINSGERSFDEFLKLLDKSQRFREWIQGINPDEKIVKAYWRDVTAEKWFQQFPAKIVRYMICLGADAIDKPSGLGLSLVDSLFLEKIIGGWRPNHFIDNKLKPFLNTIET